LDEIRVLFLELKAGKAGEERKKVSFNEDRNLKRKIKMASIGCELGEIELFIDLELPKIIKKREKHDNDRILMKQLLSNIERNRAKIRYEIFEADSLSHPRKLAISGIKEKLD